MTARPSPLVTPLRRLLRRAAVTLAVLALGVSGFSGVSPASAATGELPAPPTTPTFGPWIDQPSGYEPPSKCLSNVQPGVVMLMTLITSTYGKTSFGTTRACSGTVATSEHNEGRALDFMLSSTDPGDVAIAQSFLGWLLATDDQGNAFANARRLGVMYIIWDRQMWRAYDPVWRPYTGTSEHTDHIHISLSWEGALLQTSFWNPQMSTDCDITQPTCDLGSKPVDVYTTPGYHASGGRAWFTRCEAYGPATRCWTYIYATQVVSTSRGYATQNAWVFNNLTYVDQWRPAWDTNVLALPGVHTSGGRQWQVTCTPDVSTGPRTCVAYLWRTVVAHVGSSFVVQTKWMYNNVVRLSAPPVPPSP